MEDRLPVICPVTRFYAVTKETEPSESPRLTVKTIFPSLHHSKEGNICLWTSVAHTCHPPSLMLSLQLGSALLLTRFSVWNGVFHRFIHLFDSD